jgi:hypothetical protein
MLKYSLTVFLIVVSATISFAQNPGKIHQPKLTPQQSGTTQLLISVSPVNSRVVWAAGTGGTFVVTTDGGETWKAAVVPGAETLQFRDVFGVSDMNIHWSKHHRFSHLQDRRWWRDLEYRVHESDCKCIL